MNIRPMLARLETPESAQDCIGKPRVGLPSQV